MQNAETVLVSSVSLHGIITGEPVAGKLARRVREGGVGKGPKGTSSAPYFTRREAGGKGS